MNVIEIKQGKHNAGFFDKFETYWYSIFKKNTPIYLMFPNAAKYYLPNNQGDWNKVIGRKGFKSKKVGNSRILKTEQYIVWRYNIKKDVFEIAKYWRENYEFDYEIIQTIKPFEVSKPIDISWFESPLPGGAYFGGNMPVPQVKAGRIVYYLNDKKITKGVKIENTQRKPVINYNYPPEDVKKYAQK